MRHVAGGAAFHAYAGVFVNEWPALINVTLQAWLFVVVRGCQHAGSGAGSPRCREAAVRIVAIRALDDAFVDAMLEGHGELSLYGGVTGIAELGLFFREQESMEGHLADC